MNVLSDPGAERAVLAGICRYGAEAYFDVADIIIQESSFTVDSNSVIFKCLRHILEKDDTAKIDIPSIYSAANQLGIDHLLKTKDEAQHLNAIINMPVALSNVRKFAAKIRKLEIAKLLYEQLEMAQRDVSSISGDESITNILGIAENAIFDFSSKLTSTGGEQAETLGSGIDEFLDYLAENPVDQIGISTGFKAYDAAIGGGLRKGTINVIGARPKTGKTVLSDIMGFYIASELGIPVLNMDTEMRKEDHIVRTLAALTKVPIKDIETGKFSQNTSVNHRVRSAGEKIKKAKYHHKSIAGMPFEEQLAFMRRWIMREVGIGPDGKANPCVIIYDYLKLMDDSAISKNIQEYQALGFIMTALHNFTVKYDFPILAFMQLNRDGITKESTDAAAGSDRIIWLCSNFTIFKKKSDEEIAQDGPESGNRKLVVLAARHGEGLDDGDYINCHMEGWCARVTEGKTRSELESSGGRPNEGFEINDEDDEIPFDA